MTLDRWQALGIICGSILAVVGVLGWVVRGLRRMWRLMSKANRWLDQVLGEPARDGQPGRPGLMDRVTGIEARMAGIEARLTEHLDWHGEPGGREARAAPPRPNGARGTRRAGG